MQATDAHGWDWGFVRRFHRLSAQMTQIWVIRLSACANGGCDSPIDFQSFSKKICANRRNLRTTIAVHSPEPSSAPVSVHPCASVVSPLSVLFSRDLHVVSSLTRVSRSAGERCQPWRSGPTLRGFIWRSARRRSVPWPPRSFRAGASGPRPGRRGCGWWCRGRR